MFSEDLEGMILSEGLEAGKFREGLEGDTCTDFAWDEVGAKRVLRERRVGIPVRPPTGPLEVDILFFDVLGLNEEGVDI